MKSNAIEMKGPKPLLLSVSESCAWAKATEEKSLPGPKGNKCSRFELP